jgi:propionyl-CoA carboxylase alpha chain
MVNALNQFVIEGLDNNITFLQSIYSNQKFIAGDFSTAFIKNEYQGGFTGTMELNDFVAKMFAFCSCAVYLESIAKLSHLHNCSGQKNYNYSFLTDFVLFTDSPRISMKILSKDGARIHIEVNGVKHEFTYSYKPGNKLVQIFFEDKMHFVKFTNKKSSFIFEYSGIKKEVILRNARTAALYEICVNNASLEKFHKEFECGITGIAVGVFVKEGDFVAAGTLLFTIEAMKMENAFYAEHDAIIEKVMITPTQNVNMGDILLHLKPKE